MLLLFYNNKSSKLECTWQIKIDLNLIAIRVSLTLDSFLDGLLGLVAMILEPNFDLCRWQAESTGQELAFGRAQIARFIEPLLQLVHLRLREQDAPLSLLHGRVAAAAERRIRLQWLACLLQRAVMMVVIGGGGGGGWGGGGGGHRSHGRIVKVGGHGGIRSQCRNVLLWAISRCRAQKSRHLKQLI